MPFQSEKQRRYLWANEPAVARKFARHENHDLLLDEIAEAGADPTAFIDMYGMERWLEVSRALAEMELEPESNVAYGKKKGKNQSTSALKRY